MTPLLMLLLNATAPVGVDLMLPTDAKPIRVRVGVTLDGRSPATDWAGFLDRYFMHLDLDSSESLTRNEIARAFPLPGADVTEIRADFDRIDTDRDGSVSRVEFNRYFQEAGFTPVVVVVQPPTSAQQRISAAVLAQLDRNADGKLDVNEIRSAGTMLRRCDENEDEFLDAGELLTTTVESAMRSRDSTVQYKSVFDDKLADAVLRIDVGKQSRVWLDSKGESESVKIQNTHLTIRPPATMTNRFSPAKAFFTALYDNARGDQPTLSRSAVDSDPALQSLTTLFDPADRNADGHLTPTELASFLNLIEAGVASQLVLTIEDRGQNWFDWIDTNSDDRIDGSELRSFIERTAGGPVSPPVSYRLRVDRGPIGRSFGPVAIPVAKVVVAKPTLREPKGPRWFHSQDRTGDGFISAAEFRGPPGLFATLDRDHDGRINLAEAATPEK